MFLMEPKLTHVTSSILDAIAYDPAESRLRIRFRSGAIYDCDGVPSIVYKDLLAAPSKGGYFSEYIRPDYLYRRVRGAEEVVPAIARCSRWWPASEGLTLRHRCVTGMGIVKPGQRSGI